jgi:hypothetical protein
LRPRRDSCASGESETPDASRQAVPLPFSSIVNFWSSQMQVKKLTGAIAIASALFASTAAFAATPNSGEFYPFADIMSMKMIDKNKDGMVSKKEFMDMMSMAWDMNARKMGVKGDNMSADDFKQVLMYLKAGG